MAKPKERRYKLGRNDLCWCGSGRKYKDCHIPIEQTERREQRNLEEAQELLLPKIAAAAQEIPEAFPGALALFWNNAYTVEQMSELDDLEDHGAARFMTWFAFDYPLEDGRTLVERLDDNANQGEFGTSEFELRLLHEWRSVRLRPYIVEGIRKGQSLVVRDMFDAERYAEVKDHHASKRMEVGEVMVAHLIPVGKRNAGLPPLLPQTDTPPDEEMPPPEAKVAEDSPVYYVAGSAAQLTADTSDALLEVATLHLEDMRKNQPDAGWDDFVRQRSHVLNHFVKALPVEAYDPTMLDSIVFQTRAALHYTGSSLAGMVGLGHKEQDGDKETE